MNEIRITIGRIYVKKKKVHVFVLKKITIDSVGYE